MQIAGGYSGPIMIPFRGRRFNFAEADRRQAFFPRFIRNGIMTFPRAISGIIF